MLKLFKKKDTRTPLEKALDLCDDANQLAKELPHGYSFWMDWSVRPGQLTVNKRTPGKRVYRDEVDD